MPAADYATLRFELETREGTFLVDAQVSSALLAARITTPDQLRDFTTDLLKVLDLPERDFMDRPILSGLPLINSHPLSGRWVCSSPMGMEFSAAPPAWCFSERLELALSRPEEFPLFQGPVPRSSVADFENELSAVLFGILGPQAVLATKSQKIQTCLDEALGMSW